MRAPRILTPLKRSEYPTQCVWVDAETRPERRDDTSERHILVFGWACYRRQLSPDRWTRPQWHRFTDAAELWTWIESRMRPRSTLHWIAHNAAYDATVVKTWTELPTRGWTLKAAVVDSPPFIVHWRRGDLGLRMWDTLNIWKSSLKRIGASLDLPKLDMPKQWTGVASDDRYCRRDVEIIMVVCLRWWEWLRRYDLGGSATTIAAQALKTFRSRFLDHTILLDDNVTALELSRSAYHGGRVEVFHLGDHSGPLYLLDVRSEYPTVMQRESYPTILKGVYGGLSPDDLNGLLERFAVVADVEIDTDEACYPYKDSSPLLFPVGRFRTVLTSPELSHALARGHVRTIRQAALYEHAPIFKRYVTEIAALRQAAIDDGDTFGAWTLKFLLNALYGKFGQRGRRSRQVATTDDLGVRTWDEVDGETGQHYRMRQLAGIIEQHWVEGESRYSHPAIAAHVTGHARLYLWDLIKRAELSNVLYCDTDSVLVTPAGYERLRPLTEHTGLGSLHLDATVDRVTIHAPKDYVLDGVRRLKGVRASATWLDDSTVIQEKWYGIRSLLAIGDISTPIVAQQTKHLKRQYLKGVVMSGGKIRPFDLPGESGRWLNPA